LDQKNVSTKAKKEMKRYVATIHGYGINVVGENGTLTGFYTTRAARAENAESAKEIILRSVLDEWTHGNYKDSNRAAEPKLEIDTIRKVGLFEAILRPVPVSGYTFYGE
jgi:hypothetical protein